MLTGDYQIYFISFFFLNNWKNVNLIWIRDLKSVCFSSMTINALFPGGKTDFKPQPASLSVL